MGMTDEAGLEQGGEMGWNGTYSGIEPRIGRYVIGLDETGRTDQMGRCKFTLGYDKKHAVVYLTVFQKQLF